MLVIEKVQLDRIKINNDLQLLEKMTIGDSLYFDDLKKAQSIRSLCYYFVRSRALRWKFTFRKMDNGWRIIRIV